MSSHAANFINQSPSTMPNQLQNVTGHVNGVNVHEVDSTQITPRAITQQRKHLYLNLDMLESTLTDIIKPKLSNMKPGYLTFSYSQFVSKSGTTRVAVTPHYNGIPLAVPKNEGLTIVGRIDEENRPLLSSMSFQAIFLMDAQLGMKNIGEWDVVRT